MKKSLLALLFAVALVVPAMAENMWVGGNLSYQSTTVKDGDPTTPEDFNALTIAPEFGYSLNEKWDIGLDLSYTTGKGAKNADEQIVGDNDISKIGIVPFARYHITQIGDFDIMLKGSLLYEKITETPKVGDDVKSTKMGVYIVPVVSYSINEKWSIGCTLDLLSLGYSTVSNDDNSDIKTDEFGFNVNKGSIIGVNFSYHF